MLRRETEVLEGRRFQLPDFFVLAAHHQLQRTGASMRGDELFEVIFVGGLVIRNSVERGRHGFLVTTNCKPSSSTRDWIFFGGVARI